MCYAAILCVVSLMVSSTCPQQFDQQGLKKLEKLLSDEHAELVLKAVKKVLPLVPEMEKVAHSAEAEMNINPQGELMHRLQKIEMRLVSLADLEKKVTDKVHAQNALKNFRKSLDKLEDHVKELEQLLDITPRVDEMIATRYLFTHERLCVLLDLLRLRKKSV